MIASLLLAQVMIETLDTRPQPAVPATAFRCSFRAGESVDGAPREFDLYGTLPLAPQGHQPNESFRVMLGSATGSPLAGPASANPDQASDWFRDYQVSRRVGTAYYVVNLKLRREGASLAYLTKYDDSWAAASSAGDGEPYRYDAVGLCQADFSPDGQAS